MPADVTHGASGSGPVPEAGTLDLSRRCRVHIVGVGGAGMSAIALVLAGMGHAVSGSDLQESALLDRLAAEGIATSVGHDAANIPQGADAVVISTAVPPTNPEVRAAHERGIPVLRRADALGSIVATRRCIAVAGSHGKTTTSSMLALVLRACGLRPSFMIGGQVNELGTNAAWDDGAWFVVEADESDGTFLELGVDSAIVTNVEPDHLDHYGGFDPLVDAFSRFCDGVPGTLVVCADDPVAARFALSRPGARTYGVARDAHYRMDGYSGDRGGGRFDLVRDGVRLGEIRMPLPGLHNATNAAGAAALALEVGADFDDVAAALARFAGVARPLQHRGEAGGVTFVDDYAHLPSEVAAAIAAAREGGWRRLVVVFQPHRYSRTASLWRDFADAFCGADALVLTDVYSAGEEPRPGVSGRLLVRAVLDAHPEMPVAYLPRHEDLLGVPARYARPGDLVLTLGAGDLTKLPERWIAGSAG